MISTINFLDHPLHRCKLQYRGYASGYGQMVESGYVFAIRGWLALHWRSAVGAVGAVGASNVSL